MDNTTIIKVCVIEPEQLRFCMIDNNLEAFQAVIGGNQETWPLRQSVHVYFNEDGLALGLPVNHLANLILPQMQSKTRNVGGFLQTAVPFPQLVGNVIVVGSQEPDGQPDGEEHTLTRRAGLDLILAWLGRPLVGDKL